MNVLPRRAAHVPTFPRHVSSRDTSRSDDLPICHHTNAGDIAPRRARRVAFPEIEHSASPTDARAPMPSNASVSDFRTVCPRTMAAHADLPRPRLNRDPSRAFRNFA